MRSQVFSHLSEQGRGGGRRGEMKGVQEEEEEAEMKVHEK